MAPAPIEQTKACTKCGVEKPVTEFSPRPDRSGGFRSKCKICTRAAVAEYRAANPDKGKAYREENRDASRLRMAAWRARNPDRNKEVDRRSKERNREKMRERGRERYAKNRDAVRERRRLARLHDHAKTLAKEKEKRAANRDRENEKARMHCAKRRSTPRGALENAIRVRIHKVIKTSGKGGRRTFELLGYSSADLMAHLERQFSKGMNWENYGEWHIDHIRPVSSFSYNSPDDPDFKECWALTNLRPLWAFENLSKGARVSHLI